MKRKMEIQLRHSRDITLARDRFGDHEDINEPKLVRWLNQFSKTDVSIGVKILKNIKYYDASSLRAKVKQLVKMISDEYPSVSNKKIAFIPIEAGLPGGGSSSVARVLRTIPEAKPYRIMTMLDFNNLKEGECSVAVFFDDFSGTGRTLNEWWQVVSPMVLPKGAKIILALIVVTMHSRTRISEMCDQLISVDEICEDSNIFSETNLTFSSSEKTRIEDYCKRTKCPNNMLKGFGELGLLLAFKHGCPNNSIPILWCDNDERWEALFKRRAI